MMELMFRAIAKCLTGLLAMELLLFLPAGLDFRFGWTTLPMPVVVVGSVLFLTAYGLYIEVMPMPLVLGSGVAIVPFLFVPAVLVKRIRNEEEVLEKGLPGYGEYKKKVRYRMIPFVW